MDLEKCEGSHSNNLQEWPYDIYAEQYRRIGPIELRLTYYNHHRMMWRVWRGPFLKLRLRWAVKRMIRLNEKMETVIGSWISQFAMAFIEQIVLDLLPAVAIVCPYPIDWTDTDRFYYFAGHVMAVAAFLGVNLRYGGDWDGDKDLKDNTFNDLCHFELVDPKPDPKIIA